MPGIHNIDAMKGSRAFLSHHAGRDSIATDSQLHATATLSHPYQNLDNRNVYDQGHSDAQGAVLDQLSQREASNGLVERRHKLHLSPYQKFKKRALKNIKDKEA